MLEEKTDSGEWWLPDNPDKKIKGKLAFNQTNGATLELVEPFDKPYKTIFGINTAGREITLIDCFPLSLNFPGSPYKIFAQFTFLGAHFNNLEEAEFDSLHFQLSNLSEWLWKSGIKTEGEFSNNISIRYDSPDPISITINPELKFEIRFYPHFSSTNQNTEIQLKQIAQISLNPKASKNIDEYLSWMHHFRNFLCLVTQTSVFPQEIIGLKEGTSMPLVDVLYKLDSPINTEPYIYNSLLSYKDIENKFETCIKNWYRKYDNLEPVFTLYFGTHYGRFVYLNLRFLCLVQALEAYHRRVVSNEELQREQHKERIGNILATVPAKYKEWLQNKLTYSNEPTLRKRLNDIYDVLATKPMYLFLGDKAFINKVTDTRNYMTHYDLKLKKKVADGNELYTVTEKLKILVELCLMKEIGLSMEEISALTRQKYVQRLHQLPR